MGIGWWCMVGGGGMMVYSGVCGLAGRMGRSDCSGGLVGGWWLGRW